MIRSSLVVLTRRSDKTSGLAESHDALAQLARNSRHNVVGGADPEIHLFVPPAVIEAIQDIFHFAAATYPIAHASVSSAAQPRSGRAGQRADLRSTPTRLA